MVMLAHGAELSMDPGLLKYAWLLPLIMVVSAFLTLFFGKKVPTKGPIFGISAIGLCFALSLGILWHFVQGGGAFTSSVSWFSVGGFTVDAGQYVDGLTAVMLLVVTAISLCVHIYSLGYMHGDVRYTWFYVVLSMFTAAMMTVLIADNLILLLVGWEVMGVCSYLLIGHWFEEKKNSNAAIKAFLTTRVGDVFFMLGIFTLIGVTGTANIVEVGKVLGGEGGGSVSKAVVSLAALLLFGGTVGKSAQFPLHVWLPDAMAGPTPVSALIHAATMVAAGVYLVGRLFEVFLNASEGVLLFVSIIAAITMLGAALLAIVQDDIKKVLAYSTISQLSFMVAGLSLGEEGYTAGFFHLFTHAFFKALLFLGAGSVIHGVHSNNMSDMGGLRKKMPITFWTFLIGSLALAGVPPLAGFWSKDELLVVAWHSDKQWLFYVLLITAVCTAFYMTRTVLMTFFGEYRGHAEHVHESSRSMTGVLVALAGATCFVGLLGSPQLGTWFADWVEGHPVDGEFVGWIAALSVVAGLGGIAAGYALYKKWREPDPVLKLGLAYTVLDNKYYLDDVYMKGVVLPVRDKLSAFVMWINKWILDGIVNGAARLARGLAVAVYWFDQRFVDGVVNLAGETAEESGAALRTMQSGRLQRYALLLFAGVAVLTIAMTALIKL